MRILIILLALTVPALAQPKQPDPVTPSALDQALGQKLMDEINSCLQLRAQLIEAQARIKELESKQKPTPK